jgi:hypothetical protein
MIIIEPTFDPAIPLNNSRIGINSIVRTGTVTASSAQDGFPAIAAQNELTYEFWRPASLPATWVVDAGNPATVDYVGIAAHTLGDTNTNITVEYSTDNSTWVEVDTHTPSDDSPIMFLFAPITARYWRLVVSAGGTPSIGVVYIGKVLEMQRACFAGLSPINFSRNTVIRPNRSENGVWLGRSIIREGSSMSVEYKHLEYQWYKANFDPFVEQARKYPFFFAWRPQSYPETIGYVWTSGDISPSTMGIKSLLQVGFEMQGLAIE